MKEHIAIIPPIIPNIFQIKSIAQKLHFSQHFNYKQVKKGESVVNIHNNIFG